MKKIFVIICAALFAAGVNAQKMRVWSNNELVFERTVETIDSITFIDNDGPGQILPYFVGAVANTEGFHDFSDDSDHDAFIRGHVGINATSTIKFNQYESSLTSPIGPFAVSDFVEKASQFIVAVPAKSFTSTNWLSSVVDRMGGDWTNATGSFSASRHTINIYGESYYIYSLGRENPGPYNYFGTAMSFTIYLINLK